MPCGCQQRKSHCGCDKFDKFDKFDKHHKKVCASFPKDRRHISCVERDWGSREAAELATIVDEFLRKHSGEFCFYGSRALNHYLPPYLQLTVSDSDLMLYTPRRRLEAGQLERFVEQLTAHLAQRYPHRGVAMRAALNNAERSRSIFVGRRHVLDVSLPPPNAPSLPMQRCENTGFQYIGLNWLLDDLRSLQKNESARYRWDKDRRRLERLCLADALGALQVKPA